MFVATAHEVFETPPPPAAGRSWRWWLFAIALILLLGATAGFIGLSRQREQQHRQDQQIADTLWLEQTIRFELTRDEEVLSNLGRDIDSHKVLASDFESRASGVIRNARELQAIRWVDGAGTSVAAVSAAGPIVGQTASDRGAMMQAMLRHSNDVSLRYSEPYGPVTATASARGWWIDLYVPLHDGLLVATFSLDRMLAEMVPWWFAQNNVVSLSDASGARLARRAAGGPGRNIYTHTTVLDLAGTSLYLRTDSLEDSPRLVPNLLATAVVLLALTLMGTLWALRRDTLRRSSAEARLREQTAFRKAMEDSLITGLRARDLEGRVTYVNPAFCKMVGFSDHELLGRLPPMPYWIPDAIDFHRQRFAQILAGGAPAQGYESVFQHKDGSRIQVLIYEAPLIDALGRHTGWMSSVLDVTERRRIEEINRQQQEKLQSGARLAVIGEIASMLSHELNQPLAAITSYASGSLNLLNDGQALVGPSSEPLRDAVSKIEAQATRAGRIIQSIHDLLKRREPVRLPCEMGSIVRTVLPLVEMQARRLAVRVEVHLPDETFIVEGDRIMLEQVILNLTRNAIEAMQDQPAHERALVLSLVPADGVGLWIEVADRGPGVPSEVQERLFTPFYSTKPEGMGMGLSICRSAIEFHGGHLEYRPRAGGGALFRFRIPLRAATPMAEATMSAP